MTMLLAASAFFLLIHFAVSGTRLRDVLVARLGERPYRIVFALSSIVGIVWMSTAWRGAPVTALWGPLPGLLPVATALAFVAFLLIVIGLATPAPTRVGMESRLVKGDYSVRGITRITRHPFLWGAALWALVHVVMNGDLASLIFFGSFLLLALIGTTLIDAKRRRQYGEQWNRFATETSNVPFGAITMGRNQLGPALREIGILRPLIAVAVFAVFLSLHGRLFGVALVAL